MLKFFRKIRYNLMEQNKTGKYLKYAIGEIVLVVIGILIALQINNWNETNKLNHEEEKLLISLNVDFQENKIRLAETIQRELRMINYSTALIQIMATETKNIPIDSISNLIAIEAQSWWRTEFVTGSYDAILSSGNLNVLKNDELKRLLAEFSAEVKSGFEDHDESMSYLIEYNKQTAFSTSALLYDKSLTELGLVRNDEKAIEMADEIIDNKTHLGLLIHKTALENNRIEYQYKIENYIDEILLLLKHEQDKK